MPQETSGPTARVAERVINTCFEDLSMEAVTVTKQCLMDFIGVALAGTQQPLAGILLKEVEEQGGHPQASMFRTGRKANLSQAALFNGTAGHALDYDDVNGACNGHPTVPVAPAVLALAEHNESPGRDVVRALACGIDAECLVVSYTGRSPYRRGWHSTGTVGCFGATAASAQLLGLDAATTAQAFGIAGTQAGGLKAVFGTMNKPLHAGHAAATGIVAASLAKRGYSSRSNILEAAQGFGATQSDEVSPEQFERDIAAVDSFVPDTNYKYHAAGYLVHSAIEAARALQADHDLDVDDIDSIEIKVDSGHFTTVNIPAPSTGLEAKFSLRFAVAMALHGVDTARIESFNDDIVKDPALIETRDKAHVVAFDEPAADTRVTIATTDGRTVSLEENVAIPERDLDLQWRKLEAKFHSLVDPLLGSDVADELIAWCRDLDNREDLDEFWDLLRG
ncbi:MAG: MmgE/PrpD family protein [Gammaproteobacteria bacterium]|nr:MmgE/PrpD family protein [Gammaproteobacteria bacterium]